jgi:hypothetical protein
LYLLGANTKNSKASKATIPAPHASTGQRCCLAQSNPTTILDLLPFTSAGAHDAAIGFLPGFAGSSAPQALQNLSSGVSVALHVGHFMDGSEASPYRRARSVPDGNSRHKFCGGQTLGPYGRSWWAPGTSDTGYLGLLQLKFSSLAFLYMKLTA